MNILNPSTILNASNANIKFNSLFRKYAAVCINAISPLFKCNFCHHLKLFTMGGLAYIFQFKYNICNYLTVVDSCRESKGNSSLNTIFVIIRYF